MIRKSKYGSSSIISQGEQIVALLSPFSVYRKAHACCPPLWSTNVRFAYWTKDVSQSFAFWLFGCVFQTNFTWAFFSCVNLSIRMKQTILRRATFGFFTPQRFSLHSSNLISSGEITVCSITIKNMTKKEKEGPANRVSNTKTFFGFVRLEKMN